MVQKGEPNIIIEIMVRYVQSCSIAVLFLIWDKYASVSPLSI
jgi:hypothetical protein